MIKTPKLHGDDTFRDGDLDNGWYFCGGEVREYFKVPEKVVAIQFVAHDKPGPGRVAVKLVDSGVDWLIATFQEPMESDSFSPMLLAQTSKLIRKLIGNRRNWYVTCYYWMK